MNRSSSLAILGAASLTLLAACENPAEVRLDPADVGGGVFDRYVSLGNSITAGWQSGGINDSTQRESYAVLLAGQMGTSFAYPQLGGRGCAPPIVNFQTQARVGGAGVTDQTCDLRASGSAARYVNNVAVPNAFSYDPFTASTPNSNALTTFLLGGRTQVEMARLAEPTFASVWIGNNDVLIAGIAGVLTPMANVSPGVTSPTEFAENYARILDDLAAGNPDLEGVLIGVVDVRQTPILFPAAALFNPQFKAGFDQFAGAPVTLHPNCTPTTTSLVSFRIVSQIRTYVGSNGAQGHPPVIACEKGQFPQSAAVGEVLILDAAEQATIAATVLAYNQAIAAEASERGWAFYDPNIALQQLKLSGAIPQVPNLASETQPFGPYISLDGVHPSGAAHRLVANGVIEAINATYGTSIPALTP